MDNEQSKYNSAKCRTSPHALRLLDGPDRAHPDVAGVVARPDVGDPAVEPPPLVQLPTAVAVNNNPG